MECESDRLIGAAILICCGGEKAECKTFSFTGRSGFVPSPMIMNSGRMRFQIQAAELVSF